jgi:transposase
MSTTNPLIVGIDVHRTQHTVCMMDRTGAEVAPRMAVANNRPGAEAFVQCVAAQVATGAFDAVHIAAEATGWYWWHFFRTLECDPFLNQWPVALYPLNPRLTAHFKKTYIDMDHTDSTDAFVVADRLRMGRDLPPPFHYEATYLALRLLTRYRFHLVHSLVREKAYFLAILYLKASEYSHDDLRPFADVFGAASRAVIAEFASIEDIAALPFEALVAFIDHAGRRHFADPADNARRLRQVALDSYPLPDALQTPVNLILALSGRQIQSLTAQCTQLDAAIAAHLAAIPHTLDTIPGISQVFAAGLIAEIGDPARFAFDQAKVAMYAGFKWHRRQSANFQADDTRLTRTGNRYLRYYFCEAANSVRLHDAAYMAYYSRKFHEVRTHQHQRAITLTARKLVRLVVRLLTTHQPYRPGRV